MAQNTIFLWRKYAVPVGAVEGGASLSLHEQRPVVWASTADESHPDLPRWDGLEAAFYGYVSEGAGPVEAVCYDLGKAFDAVRNSSVIRFGVRTVDAVVLEEYFVNTFLGMHFGNSTPWFVSPSLQWSEIVKQCCS